MEINERLIKSIKEKNLTEFAQLIDNGADITYLNDACLVLSVSYEDYDFFNYIISLYKNIKYDNRVIKVVAKKTNIYVINKLLEFNIPISNIKKYGSKETKNYLKKYEENQKIKKNIKINKKEKVTKI